MTWWLSW